MSFIKDKIQALEKEIKDASQKYYTDGSSPLSDKEFDEKVDQLRELDPESETLNTTGWGYEVEKDTTPGAKFKHTCGEVGSLSKAYKFEEISKHLTSCPCQVSLKLDGLSVVLYYQFGKLVSAATRGDGFVGVDITEKIKKILESDRLHTDGTFTGAVRGEILMTDESFSRYIQIHPNVKNSRNTTAGIINATVKDVTDDLKYLRVYVYTVVKAEESIEFSKNPEMHIIHNWLKRNFDHVVPAEDFDIYPRGREEELYEKFKEFEDEHLPADGLVIKRDEVDWNQETKNLSYVAQAYKFESEKTQAVVKEVEWNLSKTKYLVPRVLFETVKLAGTDVSAATGYNALYVQNMSIGPGAVVEVEKHGEIIPCINTVIATSCYPLAVERYGEGLSEILSHRFYPTECPCCGSKLVWSGVHLKCINPDCMNGYEQDLLMWCKTLAPVKGLADSLILKFLHEYARGEKLSVENFMTWMKEEYMLIKAANQTCTGHRELYFKMCDAIYYGKFDLKDALVALNIPRLGEITASKLSCCKDAVRDWLICESNSTAGDQILQIIKDASMKSLKENRKKFERLNYIFDQIDWTLSCENKGDRVKVAVTGKLSVPRKEFEQYLNDNGYALADISKDTKYLITDDPTSNSSKNKKADQWGIEKISEHRFREMVGSTRS